VIQVHHAERWGYIVVEVNDLDVTDLDAERQGEDSVLPPMSEPKCGLRAALNGDDRTLVIGHATGRSRVILLMATWPETAGARA
jgi:hypothetical protein